MRSGSFGQGRSVQGPRNVGGGPAAGSAVEGYPSTLCVFGAGTFGDSFDF